jgi:DNA polymerase III delta prime subunit
MGELPPTFKTPFTLILAGPSGCGKTLFCRNLIRDHRRLLTQDSIPFDCILIVYQNVQNVYQEIAQTSPIPVHLEAVDNFNNSVIGGSNKYFASFQAASLLVLLDDALYLTGNIVSELFVRLSHHLNISVIFVCQNIFEKSNRALRTINLSAKYIVMFKSPRDRSSIRHLAFQMFPDKRSAHAMIDAYNDATQRPFTYLYINLEQTAVEAHRLRTNIFGEIAPYHQIIYKVK